jgi:hypothetical protein
MNIFRLTKAFSVFLLLSTNLVFAQKNLLQSSANKDALGSYLVQADQWIKYPAYADRNAWDQFSGVNKPAIIKEGERYLTYDWKVVKATDYLAFERTGSRTTMENPFGSNNTALANLVMAELTEGKGRFIDQIINGVWQLCDMSSWVLSAHLPVQKSRRSLQELDEQLIDLTSGDMGSFLAWVHHFLAKEFDKVNPVIAARIRQEINRRILIPYMQRNDLWWQALQDKPGQMVNNWNPWCNFNVLTCFLLMEKDKEKLTAAVYKTMVSTDQFINYTKEDGACEEGPSYWGHAAGKMYDYLQLLQYATGGKVDIFNHSKIKNMGEYIARSYIGNGWVVNFADASAKGGGNAGLVYRYGKAVQSAEMMDFAAYLHKRDAESILEGRDLFRAFESFWSVREIGNREAKTSTSAYTWYPQTEFCYMRAGDVFFAAKGGYNNESHNHNDVGSFMYYFKGKPFLIDAGVGTYTRFTFSSQRYTIWTMQSDYHNLPRVNGYSQKDGAQFRSRNASFNPSNMAFNLDIANAYPADAQIKNWWLRYALAADGSLSLTEQFDLNNPAAPNEINFLAAVAADSIAPGVIMLKNGDAAVKMIFDPKDFQFTQEPVDINDMRLTRVWGKAVYRISLKAKSLKPKGSYAFKFIPQ